MKGTAGGRGSDFDFEQIILPWRVEYVNYLSDFIGRVLVRGLTAGGVKVAEEGKEFLLGG